MIFTARKPTKCWPSHLTSGTPDYAMVGFILKNTLSDFGSVARGVSRTDANDYLTSVVEMMKIERDGAGAKNTDADGKITPFTGDEAVSMNFWGFTPALFPQLQGQVHRVPEKERRRIEIRMLHSQHGQRSRDRRPGESESFAHTRFLVRRDLSRRPSAWWWKASASSLPGANIPRNCGLEFGPDGRSCQTCCPLEKLTCLQRRVSFWYSATHPFLSGRK